MKGTHLIRDPRHRGHKQMKWTHLIMGPGMEVTSRWSEPIRSGTPGTEVPSRWSEPIWSWALAWRSLADEVNPSDHGPRHGGHKQMKWTHLMRDPRHRGPKQMKGTHLIMGPGMEVPSRWREPIWSGTRSRRSQADEGNPSDHGPWHGGHKQIKWTHLIMGPGMEVTSRWREPIWSGTRSRRSQADEGNPSHQGPGHGGHKQMKGTHLIRDPGKEVTRRCHRWYLQVPPNYVLLRFRTSALWNLSCYHNERVLNTGGISPTVRLSSAQIMVSYFDSFNVSTYPGMMLCSHGWCCGLSALKVRLSL